MTPIVTRLRSLWADQLHDVGDDCARIAAFDRLALAYQSPGRYYHTLDHIDHVLRHVEELAALAVDLSAVRLAAWFHDAVYDPRAADNEERSAALATECLGSLGMVPERTDRVAALILATKSHLAPESDADAAVLLDADLAILAAAEAEYDCYAADIRREYAWVDAAAYRQGRATVLRRFLDRPHIFRTPPMRAVLEPKARENLVREIAELVRPVAH